jgi:hydrogenase-1 operon protein HyaF
MSDHSDLSRPHPFRWEGEAEAQGVFTTRPDDNLNLLGLGEFAPPPRSAALSRLEDPAAMGPARDMLFEVLEVLRVMKSGHPPRQWPLDDLSEDSRSILLDALGSGEVNIVIGGNAAEHIPDLQISETVLTGVWIGRAVDADEQLISCWLEVADVPGAVSSAARRMGLDDLALPTRAPMGAMNVMPVLAEIRHLIGQWRGNRPNHVINFTLLPMTPEDMELLTQALGRMPLTLFSGGYGACQIIATGIHRVWAVQYLNSMGTVILDTLEIGDVPAAGRAADEDFEDSAERLAEILEAYAS